MKKKKVVVLGGGTGMSCLLRGLKLFPFDITAIVAVSDDGSSTGRLRQEFNMPAMGDIRNVLVALSETEPLIEKLLQYRFTTTSDLNGHSVGNLLLTAMKEINGNLSDGIEALGQILNLKGKVLPLTEDNVTLVAKMSDGSVVYGEENITKAFKTIEEIRYKEDAVVSREALKAIREADAIVFSMGSLYTSIVPNILFDEMREAILKSHAAKIYVANIMTQHGETDQFKVSDFIEVLNKFMGQPFLDVVIANNKKIPMNIEKRYLEKEKSTPVVVDRDKVTELGVKIISDNLLDIKTEPAKFEPSRIEKMIRHDEIKTAYHIFSYMLRR